MTLLFEWQMVGIEIINRTPASKRGWLPKLTSLNLCPAHLRMFPLLFKPCCQLLITVPFHQFILIFHPSVLWLPIILMFYIMVPCRRIPTGFTSRLTLLVRLQISLTTTVCPLFLALPCLQETNPFQLSGVSFEKEHPIGALLITNLASVLMADNKLKISTFGILTLPWCLGTPFISVLF